MVNKVETGFAYAKINISLDIISKMEDGYHSIKTIMQSISLYDEITIDCKPNEKDDAVNEIRIIDSGRSFLPNDERNIAVKAAKVFFEITDIKGYNLKISMKKKIPVCAGLGGGSADGACVLRMLDKMFDTNLNWDALIKLGNKVGSDIPFCIFGGTMLAEGRGGILTPITPIPPCFIVVCKPMFNCSTPELFRRVNCKKIKIRPDTDGIIAALSNNDLRGIAQRMYNVFEDFLPRGLGDIEDIRYKMLDNKSLGAIMTGSGSTVFGIFDNELNAQKIYDELRREYKEVFLVKPVS